MVRHIVMWKLKEQAEGGSRAENACIIKERLEGLVGKIDGLVEMQVGANIHAAKMYDLVLCAVFENEHALEAYDVHPLHQEIRKFVRSVIEERVVGDYAMP